MKILVVADTHKNFKALDLCVKKNQDADIIIHLGDGEHEFADIRAMYPQKAMIYVGGNCDFGNHKLTHVAKVDGYKIFCCHGHTFGVHDGLEYLAATAKKNDCKIALYGHTHLYKTEQVNGVFVMNPGSLDSPRNHNKPTFGIIELSPEGKIKMNIMAMETNNR